MPRFSLDFLGVCLRICGKSDITDTNYCDIHHFCEELDVSEIVAKLSEFDPHIDLKEAVDTDADAGKRIGGLEKKAEHDNPSTAELPKSLRSSQQTLGGRRGCRRSFNTAICARNANIPQRECW
jgi:hypothetical protein